MRPRATRRRTERYAILIVGEGDGECCLLKTLRELYARENNVSITIRNANGGSNVLARIRSEGAAGFHAVGALVDTDDHWGAQQRAEATAQGVAAFESSPCLEALLLQIAGERTHGTSRANKVEFEEVFGCPAHMNEVISRKFTRQVFDQARVRIATLDALLRFIRTPEPT